MTEPVQVQQLAEHLEGKYNHYLAFFPRSNLTFLVRYLFHFSYLVHRPTPAIRVPVRFQYKKSTQKMLQR